MVQFMNRPQIVHNESTSVHSKRYIEFQVAKLCKGEILGIVFIHRVPTAKVGRSLTSAIQKLLPRRETVRGGKSCDSMAPKRLPKLFLVRHGETEWLVKGVIRLICSHNPLENFLSGQSMVCSAQLL